MTLLHLLSYAGAAAAFVFVTLSLASGLLWISELIEEHSRLAKAVGQRAIYVVILTHFLLYFYDSLPLMYILFSIFCHIIYLQNFTSSWPIISLTSTSFLGSCVLVVCDHFLWFFYFARITQEARHRAQRSYRGGSYVEDVPNFGDIATFFGICVWLAPLFLFLSLSANDNALPTNAGTSSVPSSPTKGKAATQTRSSLFRVVFDALPLDYLPRLRRRHRDTSDGIIAPRSPSMQQPPSPGVCPTPALNHNGLSSPLLSPRRVSSDSFRPGSPSGSGFSLRPPPKRTTTVDAHGDGSGGSRPTMRRTASATRVKAGESTYY